MTNVIRWTAVLFLFAGCARGPLRLESEHRYGDSFFSGFSKRVVEYPHLSSGGRSLYFGTRDGAIFSISLDDGNKRWNRRLAGAVDADALVQGGRVYVGTSKGRFYALSETDGAELWHRDVPAEIVGAPAWTGDGLVLFGANDGVLYALDGGTGEIRWRYRRDFPDRMTIHAFAAVSVQGEKVYAAFPDGTVAALRAATGEEIWSRTLVTKERFSDVTSFIRADANVVVAGQFDGSLYALSSDGKILWSFPQGGSAAEPVIHGDRLLVPMANNQIAALDLQSGVHQWAYNAGDTARFSGLARLDDTLLASTAEGWVYVLGIEKGELRWKYQFGAPVQGAPVIDGSRAWLLTRKGQLFSFSARK